MAVIWRCWPLIMLLGGMGCRIPSGHLDTFHRMTIIRKTIPWFIKAAHQWWYNNNDKVTCCKNLEYETDMAGAWPPYSKVTKSHGRKVKSYELEVACSKLGLPTLPPSITKSTWVFKKNQKNKCKLNDIWQVSSKSQNSWSC